jgi:ABC-type antimicrobial peptide transport system permease subunit
LLTESVMLALAAAAAGVALAAWSTRALVAWATQGVPRIEQARVDPAALAFAVALGLVSSVLCGLAPTLQLARTDTQTALRDALGASTPAVVRMILESAIRPVAAGAFVGVAAAIGATRVLASQLFDVSPTDPLTIAAVVATLFAVALAASVVPARRAATVDPSRALAAE